MLILLTPQQWSGFNSVSLRYKGICNEKRVFTAYWESSWIKWMKNKVHFCGFLIWFGFTSPRSSHMYRGNLLSQVYAIIMPSHAQTYQIKTICKPNQCDFISKTITTTVQSRAGDSSCEQPVVSRDERMSRQQNIWVFRRKGQDLSLLFFPLVFHFLAKVTTTCVI